MSPVPVSPRPRILAAYLVAAALLALTSACGNGTVTAPKVTVTATQAASATPGAVTAGTPAQQAPPETTPRAAHIASRPDGTVRFHSPSGAFLCILFPARSDFGPGHAFTECTGPTRALNPDENSCRGRRAMVLKPDSDEPAAFTCRMTPLGHSTGTDRTPSDAESIPIDTLPYGQVAHLGDVECTSATTGITCRDHVTGHGFEISREGHRGF